MVGRFAADNEGFCSHSPPCGFGGNRPRINGFSRTFDGETPILTDRGQSSRLFPAHDAGLQQRESRTAVHLPFDRLQSIHVTFHRAVAPSRCHRRVHRRLVAANAFGEVANLRARTDLGPRQPLRQRAGRSLADQRRELVRKVQGTGQIGADKIGRAIRPSSRLLPPIPVIPPFFEPPRL